MSEQNHQQIHSVSPRPNTPIKNSLGKQVNRLKIKALILIFLIVGIIASAGFAYREQISTRYQSFIEQRKEETKPEIIVQRYSLCTSSFVDAAIGQSLETWVTQKSSEIFEFTISENETPENCDLIIERNSADPTATVLTEKVYLPVARFDSTLFELSQIQLTRMLQVPGGEDPRLHWDVETADFLTSKLRTTIDQPSLSQEDVYNNIKAKKNEIAIVPFEAFNQLYMVVKIDGQNPLSKGFNKTTYPLVDTTFYKIPTEKVDDQTLSELITYLQEQHPSNYDNTQLRTVLMTGTSIVGGRTHWFRAKETGDYLLPIRGIADTLRNADIAHLSNEGPFVEGCTQGEQTVVFCADPKSFEMMTFAGIDIIGVTANHELDYGADNFVKTLDLYKANGIKYYGGGRNQEEAHTPAIIELNGIKIAFLGYSFIPPKSYLAIGEKPGTAHIDHPTLKADIEKAKTQADYVFIDMQWGAEYVHYAVDHQVEYGRAAIDYGADVITGVHPHWVQGIEYYKEGIIYYGLGNFLFDQLTHAEVREGFMVEHIFYKDKYIGYNLLPTYTGSVATLQPLLADEAKKAKILNDVFSNSSINLNQ